jgi:hypothetical protein
MVCEFYIILTTSSAPIGTGALEAQVYSNGEEAKLSDGTDRAA